MSTTWIQYPAASGGGVSTYATYASLPSSATHGDLGVTLDTNNLYEYTGSTWILIGTVTAGDVTLAAVGSSPNANAASLSGQVLTLQPASGSFPGVVTTAAQTFAGDKTFTGVVAAPAGAVGAVGFHLSTDTTTGFYRASVGQLEIAAAGSHIVNIGTSGVAVTGLVSTSTTFNILDTSAAFYVKLAATSSTTLSASRTITIDVKNADRAFALQGDLTVSAAATISGTNTGDVTLSAVGAVPNANGASLTNQVLNLQPADATNPGVVTTGSQTFAGTKTFSSTIAADISGNAATATTSTTSTTATNATNGATVAVSTNASFFPLFAASSSNGNQAFNLGTGLSFNPSTNNLSTTTFTGALVGNATTATSATSATTATTATNATNVATTQIGTNTNLVFAFVPSATNGNQGVETATGITFNASSKTLTTTTFVGALTGNADTATTATNATNVATTATTTNASFFPVFVASATNGNQAISLKSTGFTFNPSTVTLSCTTFVGALTGTASGNTTYTANNHGVVLSGSGNTMTVLAPDASTTKVLISGGASADPTWGPVVVSLTAANAQTASYALLTTDQTVNFTTSTSSLTATLPTAVGYSGLRFTINKVDQSTGKVTIATTSSQTISGIATAVIILGTINDSITVESNGTNWVIINWGIFLGMRCKTDNTNTLGAGTATVIDFDEVDYDPWGMKSGSGTSWVCTIPVTGTYAISATVLTASTIWTAGDYMIIFLKVGGSTVTLLSDDYIAGTVSTYRRAHGYTEYKFAAGAVVTIVGQSQRATSLNPDNTDNYVTIKRIGN